MASSTRSTRPRPRPSLTEFLGLPFDEHRFITPHLSGPKHLQQTLRRLVNRRWTLTKALTLRAITQAVRRRIWIRQPTLQRTTDIVLCCLCPPRPLSLLRIVSRNKINSPRCMRMKSSCATILRNDPIVRKPRATHPNTATNQLRAEREGIRTECIRAI